MIGSKTEAVGIRQGALHIHPINGVHPIQHTERDSHFGARFHRQSHRGDVGVEACADVLNIEHEGVQRGELRLCRFFALPIKAVDGQTSAFIHAVGHGFVQLTPNAVFGTKQRHEPIPRLPHGVYRRLQVGGQTRVVGNQPNSLAERRLGTQKHIDSTENHRLIQGAASHVPSGCGGRVRNALSGDAHARAGGWVAWPAATG